MSEGCLSGFSVELAGRSAESSDDDLHDVLAECLWLFSGQTLMQL